MKILNAKGTIVAHVEAGEDGRLVASRRSAKTNKFVTLWEHFTRKEARVIADWASFHDEIPTRDQWLKLVDIILEDRRAK